jgi:hypothetical protein
MSKELSKYDIQANEFLEKTNTEIKIVFKENAKYFHHDKEPRDIYNCTLTRGSRSYTFTFGQSLIKSKHYKDKYVKDRLYTLNGSNLKGGYKVDAKRYLDECILKNGVFPTAYDILSCLEKYDYDSFEDFCSELGYDTDSRSAERIYNACKEQYLQLCSLYNEEEMEILKDIQ